MHLIAHFEGCVLAPYNDAAGNATVGYGHLIHAGKVTQADRARYRGFTDADAIELLAADTDAFARHVSEHVRVRLGVIPSRAAARFAALVSLAYNIGPGAFQSSTVLRLVNEHGAPRDWTPVATAMLAWCHAGGKVIPGLLHRRQAEGRVIVTGRIAAAYALG